jgi:hypothetical protein
MPVHEWKRVEPGLFHHFHQQWVAELCARLNAGGLPAGYYAMLDQAAGGVVPDVLSFERLPQVSGEQGNGGGVALVTAPPKTRYVMSAEMALYAKRANRIVVRHPLGDVVAVVEIVSPGNKSSRHAMLAFVKKTLELLDGGIHLLVVDLLPPTKRDPNGIHGVIWEEIQDVPFELPPDKPLTLASYSAGEVKTAYVDTIAVGDPLPDMPLFLSIEAHVPVPLEETYMRTWSLCPLPMREHVEQAAK